MQSLLLVCLGGAVGSGLRYLTAVAAARWYGAEFPYGTLAVNLIGSFAIGFVNQIAAVRCVSEDARLLLSVGLIGGLTTYSAFSYETVRLIQLGQWRAGVLNVVITTGGCLALSLAGMLVGVRLGR